MTTASVVFGYSGTLTASTVDTITCTGRANQVSVVNQSGDAIIYFTVGTATNPPAAPTVGGNDTYALPASNCALQVTVGGGVSIVVALISAGVPSYSIIAAF